MNEQHSRLQASLLVLVLSAAFLTASCGTTASDAEVTSTEAAETPTALTRVRRAIGVERPAATRGVTLPVGTVLHLQLTGAVASDTSRIEDVINSSLTRPVVIDGVDIVPTGATVTGFVSDADDSGRVKGRAHLAMRFTALHTGGASYDMNTSGFSRTAPATKGEDATKIGVGAGIGAAVGAILGGTKGAAEGAAIGGGAGTGVVLATRGKEVRLASGTEMTTRLTAPLTVRVAN